jgi:hypothetical protein
VCIGGNAAANGGTGRQARLEAESFVQPAGPSSMTSKSGSWHHARFRDYSAAGAIQVPSGNPRVMIATVGRALISSGIPDLLRLFVQGNPDGTRTPRHAKIMREKSVARAFATCVGVAWPPHPRS